MTRRVLYMASAVAIRCNPALKAHCVGLRRRGKAFKVAIVAVMRKLLLTLDPLVRTGQHWTDQTAASPAC